jgi:outer membrane biosynthesis protein TonB
VIALVLVVDLGLAAAGVFMLREGLREVPSTPISPSPTASVKAELPPPPPVKKAEAPSPAIEPIAKASDAATNDPKPPPPDPTPPTPTAAGASATATATSGSHAAQHRVDNAKVTRKKDGKGGPVDPYDAADPSFNVGVQVDQIMSKARPAIDACYGEAAKAVPADQVPHGVVKIAFRVLADGHFEHASVIENTTSSEQLASCLVREVTSWAMPAHTADVVDFVRAFSF